MKKSIEELKGIANDIRKDIVTMVYKAQSGHPGGVLGPQVGHVARFPEMNLDRGETVLEIDAGDARPANQSLHFVQQVAGRRGAEVCEKYLRRSHVLNKLG